jgi:hypothetical protein
MCADAKDRETFGSLWTSCAGDQPTEKECMYFRTWKTGAETLSVNVRVHVQDPARGGKSIYNGTDALVAKVRMADALREHFAAMLMDPITPQQVRRSTGGAGQEIMFYVTHAGKSQRESLASLQTPRYRQGLLHLTGDGREQDEDGRGDGEGGAEGERRGQPTPRTDIGTATGGSGSAGSREPKRKAKSERSSGIINLSGSRVAATDAELWRDGRGREGGGGKQGGRGGSEQRAGTTQDAAQTQYGT